MFKTFILTSLGGAALLLAASAAPAQFRTVNPGTVIQPGANTVAAATGSAYRSGYYNGALTGAYVPYGPYGGLGRAGGYMAGASSVIQAQGQYQMDHQQANILEQQAYQSRQDSRRKAWEQWEWEKAHTPSLEQMREESRMENVRRSLGSPPDTEVWNGKALNDILGETQKLRSVGAPGPNVFLDAEAMKHLNLSSPASSGLGLLKDVTNFQWPLALTDDAYKANREKVEQLCRTAVQQASTAGKVEPAVQRDVNKTLTAMYDQIEENVDKLSPTEFIESRRYVNQLKSSTKTFQDPNLSKYVTKAWVPKGNSVAELVDQMTSQGLKFGPAMNGEETYYSAVHQSMITFFNGLVRTSSMSTAPQGRPGGE